ncbi:hypothetical protein A8924_0488 [Saccharopolyspora erythraea NRRL 2338]|uniref:Uncharacterized protein n=2 Tax=Saccharopolyspora erythraea TaxID=1836 RepID=A4F5Y2_SACEN|nr:hypothetical protein [Saccharopolyspora erythraea]EQD84004.1 hypothetical protein N599_22300 [Saccharopolyspora erythraea D]PFG93255.1 hypothetical protein A8924_0488 [Saccharopolyspora erythraea NRRL 2338]QRK90107.1 hypothetical protein JQX30_00505 [Saccharopolyspora erythraea]CAL99456.1 hypothetical protein SACE_0103 [Saccharopolyspora erythraea NRRL 2338]
MRSVPRALLLVLALALPIAAVVVSFAITDGPRVPDVPAQVRIGSSPGPDQPVPSVAPPPGTPPAQLPPPPPDDDDDDHDADHDD